MKTPLHKLAPFLRGYIEAALFTTDPGPTGGQDYVGYGRADDMASRVPESFLEAAKRDCEAFQSANREDLDEWLDTLRIDGCDEASAGRDFWFSRNGHGVGFFDRDHGSPLGGKLQDAARKWGEAYLELEGCDELTEA